jgi:hypothetical protein
MGAPRGKRLARSSRAVGRWDGKRVRAHRGGSSDANVGFRVCVGELPGPLLQPVASGVEGRRDRRRLHTDERPRYDDPDDPGVVACFRVWSPPASTFGTVVDRGLHTAQRAPSGGVWCLAGACDAGVFDESAVCLVERLGERAAGARCVAIPSAPHSVAGVVGYLMGELCQLASVLSGECCITGGDVGARISPHGEDRESPEAGLRCVRTPRQIRLVDSHLNG